MRSYPLLCAAGKSIGQNPVAFEKSSDNSSFSKSCLDVKHQRKKHPALTVRRLENLFIRRFTEVRLHRPTLLSRGFDTIFGFQRAIALNLSKNPPHACFQESQMNLHLPKGGTRDSTVRTSWSFHTAFLLWTDW